VQVDIRDEAAVTEAVEKTVKTFDGIDILVNNASAISLTPTLDTPMKRYDLMHSVNVRGTFLMYINNRIENGIKKSKILF
jgi:citronellol/citronellal dehydrogenase